MGRRRFPNPLRARSPLARLVRTALVLILVAAALLWGLPYGLTALGRYLVVDDNLIKADAIVVLSGDGGARLEQGVALYRQGYAPRLILTGGGQSGNPPAAEVMRRQAADLGVPASAMLLVTRSSSTREDAVYTRELMVQRGLKSAILVTSPYHQRRASLTFARVFEASGITLASYPVRNDPWQPTTWWRAPETIRLTVVELAKMAYYLVSGYL